MKKILNFLPLLIIYGCQAGSQISERATQVSTGCPQEPKNNVLPKDDVKNVSLKNQMVKESGQASVDKSVGYTFEAEAGQKLSYRTADDICIWLYAPNTQLLKSGDLPITGKYTIQVSAPKGSTTFNLEMSLDTLSASAPSVSPSPSVTSSYSTSVIPSNPPSVTTEASEFTEEQALAIVQKWYEAKSRIFAPPFDTSLVNELATGTLHDKTTNSDPERGRIAWLRNNNSYYTYNNSHIDKVLQFSNSGATSYLKVRVSEELYLHGSQGIDRKNSGPYQADFIYFFQKDNGNWKIYDYSKVS